MLPWYHRTACSPDNATPRLLFVKLRPKLQCRLSPSSPPRRCNLTATCNHARHPHGYQYARSVGFPIQATHIPQTSIEDSITTPCSVSSWLLRTPCHLSTGLSVISNVRYAAVRSRTSTSASPSSTPKVLENNWSTRDQTAGMPPTTRFDLIACMASAYLIAL